jgi:hypothetical protein
MSDAQTHGAGGTEPERLAPGRAIGAQPVPREDAQEGRGQCGERG